MIGNQLCSHIMTVGGRKGTRCNRKCTRSGDETRCCNHQTVKCPECQKTFGNPSSLRRHATKVHNTPYKCKYCSAEFKQHVMYRDHIKKHDHLRLREVEPGRFVEVIEVIDVIEVIEVIDVLNSDDEDPLAVEGVEGVDVVDVVDSVECVEGVDISKKPVVYKPYACHLCPLRYPGNGSLQRHIRLKHIGEHNVCEKCEESFVESYSLKRHAIMCDGKGRGSAGEKQVKKALTRRGISYIFDTSYEVRSPINAPLRWDFRINTRESVGFPIETLLFIEYNGVQHYKPVAYWGGDAKLVRGQLHDKIKDDYCLENNYPLLWIHYKDDKIIDKLVGEFLAGVGWTSEII